MEKKLRRCAEERCNGKAGREAEQLSKGKAWMEMRWKGADLRDAAERGKGKVKRGGTMLSKGKAKTRGVKTCNRKEQSSKGKAQQKRAEQQWKGEAMIRPAKEQHSRTLN